MSAPLSGPDARSKVIGGPACRKVPRSSPSASWAGRTSTRSAPAAVMRRSASALASSRRESARTRPRSAVVPAIGGCHEASVTETACARRASEKSETPAAATETSLVRSPWSGSAAASKAVPARVAYAVSPVALSGAGTSWPSRCRARRVAAALDSRTSAPASARACADRSSPCGSEVVPVTETTTGRSRPAAAAVSRALRTAAASSGAGSAWAPWPRTRSRRSTPHVGSAASRAIRSRRSDGSIIGCARPRVIVSSPKSTTTWPGSRRSAPRARSGRSGMLERMSPSTSPATSIASSASVPPQKSPRSDAGRRGRVVVGPDRGPRRPLRHRRADGGQHRLDGCGEVGSTRPERGPVDRLAQPGGIRLEVGEHLGCRRLGDDDDRRRLRVGGEGGERLLRRAGGDLGRQVTAADAEAVADPDPGGVEQAHDLLGARAGGRDEADRPRPHDVGEAERDAADDGRAAVGAHDEHIGGSGGVLEAHLVLDRDVVREDHDGHPGADGVERLRDGVLAGHRDEGEVGARQADRTAERPCSGGFAEATGSACGRTTLGERCLQRGLPCGDAGLVTADRDHEVVRRRRRARRSPCRG